MTFSRRSFVKWAASVSTLAVAAPRSTRLVPLLGDSFGRGFRPDLLPSQKEVWDHLSWMAALGPKYTGNKAHATYREFLASSLEKLGLDIARDHDTMPAWEARRWEIKIQTAAEDTFKPKVTSYYPYSGETSPEGVTGELEYVGGYPRYFNLQKLKGKVALVDFVSESREWKMMYSQWGVCPTGAKFPDVWKPARGTTIGPLAQFLQAGAVAVVLVWTDVSDDNAQDQYTPFQQPPPQGIPGLFVGRETGAKLSALAGAGAKATVVLEAQVSPNTPVDVLIATLPGNSAKEALVINSHADGPNAVEENGGIAQLALAKYFSQFPKSERPRDIVFPITNHFAKPWSNDIAGVVARHPDLVQRTAASIAIEHLGCREWMDDAALTHYGPTGENQWNPAITKHKAMADLAMEALQGTSAVHKTAVVNPIHDNGWFGVGTAFGMAGVPTLNYICQPNYLMVGAANGCIDKLSPEVFHSQIEFFAKIAHKTNTMTAAQLKGE